MTAKEAAARLNIQLSGLYAQIKKNNLKAEKINQRRRGSAHGLYTISEENFAAFVEKRNAPPTPKPARTRSERYLSPEQMATCIELRARGVSQKRIADMMNKSESAISIFFKRRAVQNATNPNGNGAA